MNIMNYKVEGNGEALIFIHGLSDSLLYWEVLASNLKMNYQVIRVDLRGHGESELGNDEITIELYAKDLANLLNELNVGKVNLIGFSLGGAIALDFAITYPEKVASLVLMSCFSKIDNHLAAVFNEFKNALNSSFEDFYDLILPMVLCPEVIDDNYDDLKFLKHLASQTANVQAYIKAIDASLDFDVGDKLSKIDVPALILAGEYDEITPVSIQKDICAKIGNSKMIVLDDVKHNLLVGKNNGKILNILIEFLKIKGK